VPGPTPPGTLTDAATTNVRRTTLVLLAVAAVVGLVVAGVLSIVGLPLVGIAAGAAAGAGAAWWVWSGAETRVLRAIGAREVSAGQEPGLHNLTEGLCALAGLPKPTLYVLDDDARNALALGRDPRRAALVVTTGLLASLERIELEGVLAHELAHVKALDSRVGTLASTLAPLGQWVVSAVAGEDREEAADAAGVALTRYPPGLLRALEKLSTGPTVLRTGAKATAHLWLAPVPTASVTLVDRIDALRELA
jgi:heat shock protein HtpX